MGVGDSVRARLPYRSIIDRPPLKLPGDARLVLWNIVNVEVWQPSRAMPRAVLPPPMGVPLLPDIQRPRRVRNPRARYPR